MNTRQLPAIIMLTAGLITCIIAIATKMEITSTLKILLAVLVGFYILGLIVKVIFDKTIKIDKKTEVSEEINIPDIEITDTVETNEEN